MPELTPAQLPLIAGAVGALLLVLFIALSALHARRLRRALAGAQARIAALETDLKTLCTSVAGVGQRLGPLEQQLHGIEERQTLIELRDSGERSLTQAIRLANQGADTQAIISTCGLNRGEAELLMRLHGH
jgi:hypothetical protein